MDTSDTTTAISNTINGDKSDKPALRWTPRQQAIDALTQAGLGTGAIAKTLNVSRQCVQQTHQKLGRSDLKNPAFVRLAAKSVKSVLQGLSDTYEEQVVTRQGDIVTLTKSIPVRPGDKLQAAAMVLDRAQPKVHQTINLDLSARDLIDLTAYRDDGQRQAVDITPDQPDQPD